jgi:hypothetical protein
MRIVAFLALMAFLAFVFLRVLCGGSGCTDNTVLVVFALFAVVSFLAWRSV